MSFGGNIMTRPLTSLLLAGVLMCVAPVSQALAFCETDVDCNDLDACTTDQCVDTVCVFTPIDVPTVCDDGNACTAEGCDPATGCENTPECVVDADCDDSNACTADTCSADGCCVYVVDGFTVGGAIYTDLDSPITSGLEEVSACVSCDCGFSACAITAGPWGGWDLAGVPAGNCTVMPTLSGWCFSHVEAGQIGIPAPIAIVVDGANEAQNLSLQFLATQGTNFCCLVNADCDDGDACTLDECSGNTCTNTPIDVPSACDDSDACTIDICDPLIGCVNTPVDPSVFCNDDDACTIESCDPAAGCMNAPVNPEVFCDDSDACTIDTCDPLSGCENTMVDPSIFCDDEDACTIDTCEPDVGCINTPIDPAFCDDGIACTVDACDPASGCTNIPDNAACDDGVGCTEDVCDQNSGCQHTPNTGLCDDGVECTIDFCDPINDCLNTPDHSACDDGVPCTVDTCDPLAGCGSVPDDAACDDGIVCTSDTCDPVADCQSVTDSSLCDDGDDCTADVCDPVLDCTNLNLCEADLDCSGAVEAFDLAALLGAWETNPGGPPDFNLDGTVDAFDLATLLGAWGPCPLVPGACCGLEGTSVCQQLTEQKCTQAGGEFLGEGTSCAECSCGPGAGDCCSANGTAGCEENNCCDQVCDVLPSCCQVAWTSECADQATTTCGALCFAIPVNDHCADALPIFVGDTDYATFFADTDGPAHPDCEFDGQTYHDIWYDHVATCNQNLTVSTCNQAGYDTDLVVYDGCACPVSDADVLGCSDDFGPPCEFTSEVTVPVNSGNCYKIRVGGWNEGNQGTGTLTVTCGS